MGLLREKEWLVAKLLIYIAMLVDERLVHKNQGLTGKLASLLVVVYRGGWEIYVGILGECNI